MSDVTLTYKGSDILELSDSGSATLKTGGKYCEGDIGVEYVKPSGGGILNKIIKILPQISLDVQGVEYSDPFVIDCPNAIGMGTLFNTSARASFETLVVKMATGTITGSSLVGGGGSKPSGIKKVVIRSGESNIIKFANTTINYFCNSNDVEEIDAILDMSLHARSPFGWFGTGLKEVRFLENTILGYAMKFGTPTLFSDESLVSIANGLSSTSTNTLTLSTGSKDRLSTLMGTVTSGTFTADENGTVTLMDFITNTKGWTVA